LPKSVENDTDYQAFAQPVLPPNELLTPTILTQLSFILDSTASFEEAPLIYQFKRNHSTMTDYARIEIPNALHPISRDHDFRVLLISGHNEISKETFTFGAFVQGLSDNAQIVDRQDESLERTFLFQLSPIHDIFRSKIGSKAWKVADSLCFGETDAGFSMKMENNLDKLHVSHKTAGEGIYQSTKWRGNWELVLNIDRVEIRGM
jgi:hypothetical protein